MSGRLLDQARDAKTANDPTAELQEARAKRRRSPEVGLVCLASSSLPLGAFVPVSGEVSLGRGTEVTVQLPADSGLSRMHCIISKESGGAFAVADQQSKNGTFINGAKIDTARLLRGDLLRLGDALFMMEAAPDTSTDSLLVGVSEAMRDLREALHTFAAAPLPMLIVGETGTGKELAAQRAHELAARKGPLVPINAAAIPETLAEATLFGHIKGAFSGAVQDQAGVFEQAANGTLFLDEIGELALPLQAKLLRVLEGGDYSPVGSPQRKKSNARVIAATNRDLQALVSAGKFRADLYARLAGAVVELAPLRARRVDIPYLVLHFCRQLAPTRPVTFAAELLESLVLYDWPMNVRELRLRVQRMLVEDPKAERFTVSAAGELTNEREGEAGTDPVAPEPKTREEFEATVKSFHGNVVRLAKHYGRTRKQIYRWAERFSLDLETYR